MRLAIRSVAPALAAGNTVVLKPAEEAPLSCLRLGPLLAEAGIPPGVFNVVPGFGHEAGAALAGHRDINHIAFTGSVPTGTAVMKAAAENVVPVTLELGGKSPNIVFADADLELALEGAIKAIFTNAGQVCLAGSRLLLDAKLYERFVPRLVERTRTITLGPGLADPDMGPLISAAQRAGVLRHIEAGRADGAEVLTGGRSPTDGALGRGFFVEPTLVATTNESRIAQEEIFGPVLSIIRFRDDDEALRLANASQYGLVAAIWTQNLDRAHTLAARLQAGQVFINDYFSGSVATPFGGVKRSGFGRERGLEALEHYTQTKSVCIKLRNAAP
jgi:acyl-CoA reductase-like NAD-dependent aldehyde dehydrogenase